MKLDLWAGFLSIALLASVDAACGIFLLCGEFARDRAEARERIRAVAAALADSLYEKYAAGAWPGLPEQVDALAADLQRGDGLSTAFVWRKGKGVIWKKGDEQMILREIDGNHKWIDEGGRARYPKRGCFTQAEETVVWSKMGQRDVCGYVLGQNTVGMRPAAKFAAKACLVVAAGVLAVLGGWYLKRAADRAREENVALVEMLGEKVGVEEMEHV